MTPRLWSYSLSVALLLRPPPPRAALRNRRVHECHCLAQCLGHSERLLIKLLLLVVVPPPQRAMPKTPTGAKPGFCRCHMRSAPSRHKSFCADRNDEEDTASQRGGGHRERSPETRVPAASSALSHHSARGGQISLPPQTAYLSQFSHLIRKLLVDQASANLLHQGPESKYFTLCGPCKACVTLLTSALKC